MVEITKHCYLRLKLFDVLQSTFREKMADYGDVLIAHCQVKTYLDCS